MPRQSGRIVLAVVMAGWLSVLAGCKELVASDCTDELRSVIRVDVLDSISRAPAAAGATVLLRGPVTDSVVVSDTSTSSTAYIWFEDRVKPGIYSLSIVKAGYRDWAQTGIRVEADACHTTTFDHVIALLRR